MAGNEKSIEEEEEEFTPEQLNQFRTRLSYLKNAREYYKNEDYVNASKSYMTYLSLVSKFKKTDEKKLRADHFDSKRDLSEMLLISHAYFDLARIWDRSPRQVKQLEHALNQFVNFSVGFKYQSPNAGMIRRFVKKKKMIHKNLFESAAERMGVRTKKCYIASYCYGEDDPMVDELRAWRDRMVYNPVGDLFVRMYYRVSPKIVQLCERFPRLAWWPKVFIFKPIISIVYFFSRKKAL